MAGRKKIYTIELKPEQHQQLRNLVAARKSKQSEVRRAQIVLTCDTHPAWSDRQVAETVGCDDETVRKWRQRWVQTQSVQEAARSGRPRLFSPSGTRPSDGVGL
jgi:hypothetical protein